MKLIPFHEPSSGPVSASPDSLRATLRGVTGATVLVVATIVGWAAGGRTLTALVTAAIAFGGAGVVGLLAIRRPIAAFGVLLLLSSASRVTLG